MSNKRRRSNGGGAVPLDADGMEIEGGAPAAAPVGPDVQALCQYLHGAMDALRGELEAGKGKEEASRIATRSIGLAIVDLKRLIRSSHERIADDRNHTTEEREKVDSLHLQLQNLLYQKYQLQKDIRTCQEFKSKDEEIELIPEEEFFTAGKGPPNVSESIRADPHKMRLERLGWELKERKRLAAHLDKLKKEKTKMAEAIAKKTQKLEAMPGQLESLLQAATPLTVFFGQDEASELLNQDSPAQYLPRPLYILFMHCVAFRDTEDKSMTVEISGDVEAAKTEASEDTLDDGDDDEDDEAGDDADQDDGASHHRQKARRSAEEVQQERRAKLMDPHPLAVKLKIVSGKLSLGIEFRYIVRLQIVTVRTGPESGEALCHLFPGDSGTESPNPTNLFHMDNLGMDPFHTYLAKIGRPYKWAQTIAGLSGGIATEGSTGGANMQQERLSLVQVLRAIKERVEVRHSLKAQLGTLKSGKVAVYGEAAEKAFPLKAVAKLVSFTEVAEAAADAVSSDRRKLRLAFVRDKVELTAAVEVTLAYPREPPSFKLRLTKPPAERTGTENNLRAIETELNVYWAELTAEGLNSLHLLSHQVRLLQQCFDMFMESEERLAANNLGGGKLYVRGIRGKDRLRPYKFEPRTGFFEFR